MVYQQLGLTIQESAAPKCPAHGSAPLLLQSLQPHMLSLLTAPRPHPPQQSVLDSSLIISQTVSGNKENQQGFFEVRAFVENKS